MIDLQEQLVPLPEVPSLLPRRRGRRLHISSVYRWAQRGVRGVVLETVRVGGVAYTSHEALERFIAALSAPEPHPEPRLSSAVARARARDERLADELGL